MNKRMNHDLVDIDHARVASSRERTNLMIDDLKPTPGTPAPNAQRVWTLVQLVVYRYRDFIDSRERKHAAQEIADLLRELEQSWK